ncbi:hypothetical protein [Mycoplasmopsis cynos]|nr:hypothetical protein [Mycoplasmopsis cynos]UWV92936.1 hypothetical protein NWE57_02775 [Mycoplasmopsis cynos]
MINKKSLQIPDDSMIHKKYKIGRVLGYGMGVVCSVRLKDDPSTEYL